MGDIMNNYTQAKKLHLDWINNATCCVHLMVNEQNDWHCEKHGKSLGNDNVGALKAAMYCQWYSRDGKCWFELPDVKAKEEKAAQNKAETEQKIAYYTNLIQQYPDNARIYLSRCVEYDSIDDFDHAIADAEEALRLDPQYIDAHAVKDGIHFAKREYDKMSGLGDNLSKICLYDSEIELPSSSDVDQLFNLFNDFISHDESKPLLVKTDMPEKMCGKAFTTKSGVKYYVANLQKIGDVYLGMLGEIPQEITEKTKPCEFTIWEIKFRDNIAEFRKCNRSDSIDLLEIFALSDIVTPRTPSPDQ